MSRKYWLLGLFAVVLILLSACGNTGNAKVQESTASTEAAPSEAASESAAPIQLVDMAGRRVVLDGPVTRLVALTAAECEIVCALGSGDVLVGRGEYCDYPAEALAVPSVQSGYETNLEQVLALEPQVVLMGTMDQSKEQIEQLEKAGVCVIETDADTIEGVYTSIALIGSLLEKEAEAAALTDSMKKTFAEVAENSLPEGSSVYFEVSPLEWGLWTAGKGTFMNEVAEMMGLKNCFDEVEGWAEISEEQVIERDPDLIVTITMYGGEGATPEEEILGRSGWENVTAVKKKAVLNLQNNELSRPGPRLAEGAEILYQFASQYLR